MNAHARHACFDVGDRNAFWSVMLPPMNASSRTPRTDAPPQIAHGSLSWSTARSSPGVMPSEGRRAAMAWVVLFTRTSPSAVPPP